MARSLANNDDPELSFADLQRFFQLLEQRVAANAAADLAKSTDEVEIEIYDGGSGVSEVPFERDHVEHVLCVERAMIEVTGCFNHRRPAGQLVRQIVDDRSANRNTRIA